MFRFTIRDVLWLTVVVALAVGGLVTVMFLVTRGKTPGEDRVADNPAPLPTTPHASLTMKVVTAHEHLGHSISEGDSSIHPAWYDGCRGRLLDSGDDFVIWWDRGESENEPIPFKDGITYVIEYKGDMEKGVMGYLGKCVHVSKVVKVRAQGTR